MSEYLRLEKNVESVKEGGSYFSKYLVWIAQIFLTEKDSG